MGLKMQIPEATKLIPDEHEKQLLNEAEILQAAMKRPQLSYLAALTIRGKHQSAAAHGRLQPELRLFADAGYSRLNDIHYNGDEHNLDYGALLDWDFDIGGARWQAFKQSVARHRELQTRLDREALAVIRECRSLMQEYRIAKEKLVLLKENEVLSKEQRDIEEKRWRQGQSSITRFNESQTAYIRARANRVNASIALALAWERILAAQNKNQPDDSLRSGAGD